MKFPIYVENRKQTASFRIVSLLLAIAPLWLMLAAAGRPALAQMPDEASMPSASAGTTSSPADWTEFHRDNMQRWNPYETVLGVEGAAGLQLKWKIPGLGVLSNQNSPAVVNGVIYIGSGDVFALNAGTGTQLWRYSAVPSGGGGVLHSPAVVNGVVYVGATDFRGASGKVYALNASTGAKLWSEQVDDCVNSSPTVADGVVYIGSCDSLYALKAGTGAKLWSYTIENGVQSSPAVANGTVYVGADDNNVYALNASTAPSCGALPPEALCTRRLLWSMGSFISAPTTATCMR